MSAAVWKPAGSAAEPRPAHGHLRFRRKAACPTDVHGFPCFVRLFSAHLPQPIFEGCAMALAVVAWRNYSVRGEASQRIFEGAQSSVEHDFKTGLGSKLNSDVATNMAAPAGAARLSGPGEASGLGAID